MSQSGTTEEEVGEMILKDTKSLQLNKETAGDRNK